MWDTLRAYLWIDPLICLTTAVMGSINLFVSFFDEGGQRQLAVAQAWARMLCRIAGVRLTIEGAHHLQPGQSYIIASNHLSYMDTPVVMGHLPLNFRFMAKRGLFRVPFLGNHLERAGHLPVASGNPREAIKLLSNAAKLIEERRVSVLVFPEGGRAADGKLQAFKDGAFFLAIKAQVPVAPVALIGTYEMLPFGSGTIRPGPVTMRIGAPIPTAGMSNKDREALSEQTRGVIEEMLAIPPARRSR
jgi:1-acyl-sn-glycerol-3-phosphate acyltransferase